MILDYLRPDHLPNMIFNPEKAGLSMLKIITVEIAALIIVIFLLLAID